jgi:hypothetical protein
MRRGGFTYEEIAEMLTPPDRIQPFTKQSVMYAIGKIVQDDEKDVLSRGYTKTEQQELVASLLKEKHIAALRAITEEKLEVESAKDNAATAKTLFDQLRLETGKSTSNISSFSKIIESSMDEDGF